MMPARTPQLAVLLLAISAASNGAEPPTVPPGCDEFGTPNAGPVEPDANALRDADVVCADAEAAKDSGADDDDERLRPSLPPATESEEQIYFPSG